jgi:spore coat polysaccharide biosynthesis protein SpsF
MRKLVACLACRNQGTRLFGKPLQNLDIERKFSVLDYMIASIKSYDVVSEIVLAISKGTPNYAFIEFAEKNYLKYIVGDEEDVLSRLISACEFVDGTDIFRLTTESPFTYFEAISGAWAQHITNENDITVLDGLPDGSGFEMIKLEAYKASWRNGGTRHRSELCSLYIRENKAFFRFGYITVPKEIRRTDIRLTIDYPEDLVLCRYVYANLKNKAPLIPLNEIIQLLDSNDEIKRLVAPFVEEGLKTMYL